MGRDEKRAPLKTPAWEASVNGVSVTSTPASPSSHQKKTQIRIPKEISFISFPSNKVTFRPLGLSPLFNLL